MTLSRKSLAELQPLLEGGGPSETGEWNMYCPFHGDSRRSASLNVNHGLWNCHGCGRTGTVRDLIQAKDEWNLDKVTSDSNPPKSNGSRKEEPTEGRVAGWHSALLAEAGALAQLMQRRGLTKKTIAKYEIGYDRYRNAYTIPIRNESGYLINVRRYQFDPPDGRRKIWSMAGCGSPALWPWDQLEYGSVLICEGEWDALLCIQHGIHAMTRTAAARVWKSAWSHLFQGKQVFVCHDADKAGQDANGVVATALGDYARNIVVVRLPYDITDKHGKDLTDFFLEGGTKGDFLELIRTGEQVETRRDLEALEPKEVSVSIMDSFNSALGEIPLTMEATVVGKASSYSVPSDVTFTCDQKAGLRCNDCALNFHSGNMPFKVRPSDPVNLEMIGVGKEKLTIALWKSAGIVKCNRWDANVTHRRTVEEVYVRSSIEDNKNSDFTRRRLISVGTHDLQANQTIRTVGTIRPNPQNQVAEFQAWKVDRPENALDSYHVTEAGHALMMKFQPGATQRPLARATAVANDLARVTRIVGRTDMHVFVDLVLHSALEFVFDGEVEERGWLDGLIIGDTRTGKSEISKQLLRWYGMGEMVSCESASYAGVVGGLHQAPGGGPWTVSWGVIPVNDRRAVVLDEVSGLKPEEIAKMSNIRSSGRAEINKINTSEQTRARTRLLWLANPRGQNMSMERFMYGVHGINQLIGNSEDVARFDMAMGLYSDEVTKEQTNSLPPRQDSRIGQAAYRELLRWAWTRTRDDIQWSAEASAMCKESAIALAGQFTEDPPLIQGANVRVKLARIATALAIRTYSTTDGVNVVVTSAHVRDAIDFLLKIYGDPRFGYLSLSTAQIKQDETTRRNITQIMSMLMTHPTLHGLFTGGRVTKTSMSTFFVNTEIAQILSSLQDLGALQLDNDGSIALKPLVMAELRKEMQQ